MGIDLMCCGEDFSTSYSSWNAFRMKLAELCMKYIEDLANNQLNVSPDGVVYAMTDREIIRERVIIEARAIVQIWNDIVEDKKNLSLEPEEEGVDDFQAIVNKRNKELNINDYLRLFSGHTDYLINIKLKGIVSLLNKSDCEGYYSVGDSYDIVLMLNIISKRTDIEPQFMEIIKSLENLFQTSVNKKKNVTIS
jgi:hypothetical protein